MVYIQWLDSYSVKVHEIDEQHQKIIALFNEANDIIEHHTKDNIVTFLDSLTNLIAEHFMTEENYFRKFKYSGTDEHIQHHNYCAFQITLFKTQFQRGEKDISQEFLNFLRDWFETHMIQMDQKYVQCFLENGLE